MTKEEVVEKIKKLLALAGSPNEHEAKVAIARASELMRKHLVDENDLRKKDEEIIEIEKSLYDFTPKPARDTAILNICGLIAKKFNTYIVLDRTSKIKVFGFKSDIELTLYLCESLINQGKVSLGKEIKTFGIGGIASFWIGYFKTLYERLSQIQTGESGLVLYNKAKDFANSKYNLHDYSMSPFAINLNAYDSGAKAAQGASFAEGVREGKGPRRLT